MLITVHARAHPQAFSQILLCHVDVGQAFKKKKKGKPLRASMKEDPYVSFVRTKDFQW